MSDLSLPLVGLDGSNPLAFLAALGTLRTLSLALPDERVKMSWSAKQGFWCPSIHCPLEKDPEQFIAVLHAQLQQSRNRPAFDIGDNLNLPAQTFRKLLLQVTYNLEAMPSDSARIDADFLAAFGSDAIADENGVMEDTAFRTMSGAGHQHFLKFFRELVVKTEESHLERALLHRWDYADEGRGRTLRWDPSEDRRYALRWNDPSGDPVKTMRGANRLAIEALPMLTTMPTSNGLATTAVQASGRRNTFFIWPVWSPMIDMHVVRSLLTYACRLRLDRQRANENGQEEISKTRTALGIAALFASARITTGKFRNFTPSSPV